MMQIRKSQTVNLLAGLMLLGLLSAAVFPATSVLAGPAISTPLDLNSAGPEALATLPGIGSVKADAIVSFRTENGPFSSIEGLLAVPGIGARLMESIRELITVTTR
jgi:competence protein ComEA